MNKLPVIIDTDPGVDDAFALIMCFNNKNLDIKLISTVAGNICVEQNTKNAIYLVQNYRPSVMVAQGAEKPLKKHSISAEDVHGKNGLGNFIIPILPIKPNYLDVQKAYFDVLNNAEEPITLITLGPMTNLANLITKQPELLKNIKEVYSMVGSYNGKGNIKKYAEFNAYYDPDALDIVLNSNLKITFISMEVGHETKILKTTVLDREITNPTFNMYKQMMLGVVESAVSNEYFACYDLNVPLYLKYPQFYDVVNCNVTVNISGQVFMEQNKNGKFKCVIVKDNVAIEKSIIKELYGE